MNKYEQMVKFNMSMVRYYADKCVAIGLFDEFDCSFKPLDLSESDLNLWEEIAEFSGNNDFETFRIVSEQYANESKMYSANQMENTKTQF